jgi:hypothetical protein
MAAIEGEEFEKEFPGMKHRRTYPGKEKEAP